MSARKILASKSASPLLTAGERDGASDDKIAVLVRDKPLGDVMNALWSLMSYRNATWDWRRGKSEGKAFSYHLARPALAKQFALRLQSSVQDPFEAEAATAEKALKMTPEQLEQAAKTDRMIGYMQQDERLREGLRVFFSALDPAARTRVLRGQEKVRVPVEELSPAGRAFVDNEFALAGRKMHVFDDGSKPPPGATPRWITFRTSIWSGKATPSMTIAIEGIASPTYIGGTAMEREYRQRIEEGGKGWMLPPDQADNPLSAQKSVPPSDKNPTWEEQNGNKIGRFLDMRLSQLARTTPGPCVMARLPGEQKEDPGRPYNLLVAGFLQSLEVLPAQLAYKWRQSILRGVLLRTLPEAVKTKLRTWFNVQQDGAPPDKQPVAWRREVERPDPKNANTVLAGAAFELLSADGKVLESRIPSYIARKRGAAKP